MGRHHREQYRAPGPDANALQTPRGACLRIRWRPQTAISDIPSLRHQRYVGTDTRWTRAVPPKKAASGRGSATDFKRKHHATTTAETPRGDPGRPTVMPGNDHTVAPGMPQISRPRTHTHTHTRTHARTHTHAHAFTSQLLQQGTWAGSCKILTISLDHQRTILQHTQDTYEQITIHIQQAHATQTKH